MISKNQVKKNIKKLLSLLDLMNIPVYYDNGIYPDFGVLVAHVGKKSVSHKIFIRRHQNNYSMMFTLIHESAHAFSSALRLPYVETATKALSKQSRNLALTEEDKKAIVELEENDLFWWFVLNDILGLRLSREEILKQHRKDMRNLLEHFSNLEDTGAEKKGKKSRGILQGFDKKLQKKNRSARKRNRTANLHSSTPKSRSGK